MAGRSNAQASEVSNPIKRIRWATHRAAGTKGDRKRQSVMDRFHRRKPSAEKAPPLPKPLDGDAGDESPVDGRDPNEEGNGGEPLEPQLSNESSEQGDGRTIYFNMPLPEEARDETGRPIAHYVRNKIRTSKYTPLSFVPKNLWFQFHNVANVYFLIIVILGIFAIFGVEDPALNAVPLIFILTVTAIKDGIEDWRRTILDNELNNAPIHRLVDFNNVNTSEDKVSLWRQFKKACTRAVVWVWRNWIKRNANKEKTAQAYRERATGQRPSLDTRRTSYQSRRTSYHSTYSHAEEGIQMTPVPSPLPGQTRSGEQQHEHENAEGHAASDNPGFEAIQPGKFSNIEEAQAALEGTQMMGPKQYGSVMNPFKQVPDRARFKSDFWKNVQVGDFVRLYNEEEVPADMVVLSTSEQDGQCYVETKNLDGETNLKVRQAVHCGRKIKHARHCERAEFVIESEPPHPNLYAYSGVVRYTKWDPSDPQDPGEPDAEPIGVSNLLLRGSSVRNTEWVLGVVVFTGEETKIMLNSGITPSKRAKISKDLNWNVIYNFMILFCMCVIAAVVQGTAWAKSDSSQKLFEFGSYGNDHAYLDGIITFWAAVILFQNLVPVSLYITLEIIRTAQALFIYSDVDMYYEKIDYPCTPKSWNISDDLGQIEYIFSDKTGTLTQNVMEFKKCTINGVPYGEAYTEAQAGMQRRQGINVEEEGARAREQIARDRVRMLELVRKMHDNPYLRDDELTFVAPDYISDLGGEAGEEQRRANERFMLALALCHSVITEKIPGDPPKIEFKAQSPDEAALVATAKDCGFTVLGREDDELVLNVMGEERRYGVLNTLEFNSARKRMSSIVRMPDGKIVMFCKGADSVIYSRLRAGEQPELRASTAEHLEMFAREGLRTLCIAQRELDETEYQLWNKEHDIAASAVEKREEKLDKVAEVIERDLTLLGGTAIEDRLQDGVPDSIQLLGRAGIKLWVLTGDKVETAINIGFSCNLLDNDMDLLVLKVEDDSLATAEAELDKFLSVFNMTGSDEELRAAQDNHEPPDPTHAIVVDGETLKLVLHDDLKQKFLLLCKQCRSVLCCRVSPSQKAGVVRMVKRGLDCLTLAVGDGANDVAMIQEAHVGIGIAGVEGRAAVMSSDFAIGQFRYLTRLVLVHGRWSYRRLAETIANFFYKNLVWTFALFWYQIYDNFDCTYNFDYSYIILYNLAFTSLPVILMGVLDQDVDDKVSLAVPQLYRRGIERKEWTRHKFWGYMFDGFYQSAITYFMSYMLFAPATFNTESGHVINDGKRMGVYIASTDVVVVNIYMLMNTYRWDWLMLLIVAISILLIWFWTGVYTAGTLGFTFHSAAPEVYAQPSFWGVLFLTVVICLAPRFAGKSFQKIFMPRDIDIVREQVRQGKFDYLRDESSIAPPAPDKLASLSSSELSKPMKENGNTAAMPDDERPIYPPSVAPTATTGTHNPRSQNGSDGTDYTGHPRPSDLERPNRFSMDRPRPSYDRVRMSMDRVRPSFEATREFTSAAMLRRIESSQSATRREQQAQPTRRRFTLSRKDRS
ncbi:hypothetical protein BDY21DRAFT_420789 [Lineolata rhizophorae]|uniref:Phospholipid-transporting ATPase n=1 Tax=Lineolata rhizophorae TaxID=578093 RepID=A0A6A6P264_9PEZI|nr:hypothetical protein BDY21DRAFT_420789 [Lineolata rhizophorae]